MGGMGTIASVMQFKCETCGLINPTERSTCFCGTARGSKAPQVDNKEAAFVLPVDRRPVPTNSSRMELANPGAGLSRSVSQNTGNFEAARQKESPKHKSQQQPHSQLKHSVSYSISAGGCTIFYLFLANSY